MKNEIIPINKIHILLIVLMLFSLYSQAQNSIKDKLELGGYISNMGKASIIENATGKNQAYYDYILHNRLNLAFYANEYFTFKLQMRNQFMFGESFDLNPNYAKSLSEDMGYSDLKWNWWESSNNTLNTQIDRFYLEYMKDDWELALGRQRINWGRTLVWNPNDIFNAFSYYDIDYPERPGSDALRVKRYWGASSESELVAKMDSAGRLTLAGMSKFNRWGYDIQFMAAYVNEKNLMFGAGWEGNIKDVAFRGELSYYQPKGNFWHAKGYFLSSLSLDYTINAKWTTQFEFLYNDPKSIINLSQGTQSLLSAPSSPMSLSFSEFNYFANVIYLINPITSVNVSAMYYNNYKAFFVMPNINISTSQNTELSLMCQYFNFDINNKRQGSTMAFVRFKWNF